MAAHLLSFIIHGCLNQIRWAPGLDCISVGANSAAFWLCVDLVFAHASQERGRIALVCLFRRSFPGWFERVRSHVLDLCGDPYFLVRVLLPAIRWKASMFTWPGEEVTDTCRRCALGCAWLCHSPSFTFSIESNLIANLNELFRFVQLSVVSIFTFRTLWKPLHLLATF